MNMVILKRFYGCHTKMLVTPCINLLPKNTANLIPISFIDIIQNIIVFVWDP